MSDTLTTVIDRENTQEAPRTPRKKRVWMIILACVTALALAASSTLAVTLYLDLQTQAKRYDEQTAKLSAIQAQLSAQEDTLQEQADKLATQEGALQEQADKLTAQESALQEQADKLTAQENTIAEQDKTIQSQAQTIQDLRSLVAQKNTNHTAKPLTFPLDITSLQGKKLIALTFDDGPGPYTARLLDALKASGARATFFVVGSRVNSYSSLIKRMEAEGHVVGNHSQNHKNLKYLSAANIAIEMGTAASRIKAIIGHDPYVMRCPGGNYNSTVLSYAKSINTPIIQWSVDTIDWRDRNANTVLNRAKAGTKDGAIVLMHDIYSTTVDAAIAYIRYLQQQGYTLVTVPELLAAKQGTVDAGKVYFHA